MPNNQLSQSGAQQSITGNSCYNREMNSLKIVDELFDISSSEDEEGILERASKPLPPEPVPNYGAVPEISRSSAEAVAGE